MKKLRNLHLFYSFKIQLLFLLRWIVLHNQFLQKNFILSRTIRSEIFIIHKLFWVNLIFLKTFLMTLCTNLITKHSRAVTLSCRMAYWIFPTTPKQFSKAISTWGKFLITLQSIWTLKLRIRNLLLQQHHYQFLKTTEIDLQFPKIKLIPKVNKLYLKSLRRENQY